MNSPSEPQRLHSDIWKTWSWNKKN